MPDALAKKIVKEAGREDRACWTWTGGVRRARFREKKYRTPADLNHNRNKIACWETERATPEVRDPRKGEKAAAHRVVYGWLTGVYIDDVPELERCANPLCVNPHHVTPKGPTALQRKRMRRVETTFPASLTGTVTNQSAAKAARSTEPAVMTDEEVLAALQQHRPFVETDDLRFVEEECEIPSGRLTFELWVVYVNWDADNPEDD